MILANICWPKIEDPNLINSKIDDVRLLRLSNDSFTLRDFDKSISLLHQIVISQDLNESNLSSSLGIAKNNMGCNFFMKSDFSESLNHFEESIRLKNLIPNTSSISLALTYTNFALCQQALGKLHLAKQSILESFRIITQQVEADREILSWLLDVKGVIESSLAKYEEAEVLHNESLKIKTQICRETDPEIGITKSNIAFVYASLEKRNEAVTLLEESNKYFDREDNCQLEKAIAQCNINVIKFLTGKELPQHYSKVIEDLLPMLPDDHVLRAKMFSNIANIQDEYSHFEETFPSKKKALAFYLKIYPDDKHPDLIKLYDTIGNGMMRNWKYDQSLFYLEKALSLTKLLLPEFHPDTAKVFQRLGILAQREGYYLKKLDYYTEALRIYENCFQERAHPQIARIYNNLGFTYTAINNYQKALRCHMNAMKVKTRFLPINDKKMAINYWNIGMVLKMKSGLQYSVLAIQKSKMGYERNGQVDDVEVCDRSICNMSEDIALNTFLSDINDM